MHNKTAKKSVCIAVMAITLLFAVSCDDADDNKTYSGTINGVLYDLTIFDGKTFELTVDGKKCTGNVQGEQNGAYVLLGNGTVFYVVIGSGKITGATGPITFDNGDKFTAGSSSTGNGGQTVNSELLGKWQIIGEYSPRDVYYGGEYVSSFETIINVGYEFSENKFITHYIQSIQEYDDVYTDDTKFYGPLWGESYYWFEDGYLYFAGYILQKVTEFSWK